MNVWMMGMNDCMNVYFLLMNEWMSEWSQRRWTQTRRSFKTLRIFPSRNFVKSVYLKTIFGFWFFLHHVGWLFNTAALSRFDTENSIRSTFCTGSPWEDILIEEPKSGACRLICLLLLHLSPHSLFTLSNFHLQLLLHLQHRHLYTCHVHPSLHVFSRRSSTTSKRQKDGKKMTNDNEYDDGKW